MQLYVFGACMVHRWLATRMLPNRGLARPASVKPMKITSVQTGAAEGLRKFLSHFKQMRPPVPLCPTPQFLCLLNV